MRNILWFLMCCCLVTGGLCTKAFAGTLQNGGSVDGFLATGAIASYSFVADAGDRLSIQAVDTGNASQNISPYLFVYRPDGSRLGSDSDGAVASLVNYSLNQSGEYNVQLSHRSVYGGTGSGPYSIHLSRVPGADEHGELPNGGSKNGTLTLGDIDTYVFDGDSGDSISIQVVDTGDGQNANISPYVLLFNPDGSLRGSDSAGSVAGLINYSLAQTGRYSVQVLHRPVYGGTGGGPYAIHFARAPGADEGGVISNGGSKNGTLTLGDIDTYTFQADAGDRVSIQVGDTGDGDAANISPYLHLYNPDGSLRGSDSAGAVAGLINYEMQQSGTYTVQVSHRSVYGGSGAGPYTVHLAKAPGADEGGKLPNGGVVNGALTLGDIDTYTFVANADDTVSVQVSDTGDGQNANISPYLHIYNPDGSLRASDSSGSVAGALNLGLSRSGVYTVQISHRSVYGGTGVGSYSVSFNCAGVCADVAPAAPIGINPDGAIDDTTPEYQWYAVSNATWYYLRVTGTQGVVHQKWYTAADAGCGSGSGTCAVTPSVSITSTANWRVYGWNSTGSGPWSTTLSFNVRADLPAATTLISPSVTGSAQPTFTWERVANSSWYYLWVSHNGTSFKKWYKESDANCGASTCSVTPSLNLSGPVTWWVRTWNTSGNGDWSSSMRFTVSAGGPGKVTLYSPSGSNAGTQPTFQWGAVADATWYQLWVNDSTGTPIRKWYTRAQTGCESGSGTCRVTANTAISGSATWWIQTSNSSGSGPWSNGLSFTP